MMKTPASPPGHGTKSIGLVLIVDDMVDLGNEVVDILARRRISAMWLSCAQQAIDYLEKHHAAVVFSDIDMPGPVNGIGLARWVLKNRLGTKMILTSGNFPELDPSDPIAEIPFLLKPVKPNQLLKVLSETDEGR